MKTKQSLGDTGSQGFNMQIISKMTSERIVKSKKIYNRKRNKKSYDF